MWSRVAFVASERSSGYYSKPAELEARPLECPCCTSLAVYVDSTSARRRLVARVDEPPPASPASSPPDELCRARTGNAAEAGRQSAAASADYRSPSSPVAAAAAGLEVGGRTRT